MAREATARKIDATPARTNSSNIKMVSPKIEQGNTKAALEAAGATKGTFHFVPVEQIHIIPRFNVRMSDTEDYQTELTALANAIKKDGFNPAHPLSGFVGKDGDNDVIYVIDGHKRYAATLKANTEGAEVTTVPIVLKPKGFTMREANVAMHRENLHSKLTMAEKAIIVNRLVKMDMTVEEIAAELDITERSVQDFLLLVNASKIVRNIVKSGRVSGTEAVRLLRKHAKTPGKAETVMQEMVAKADARGEKKASRKHTEEGTKTGRTVADESEDTDKRTDGKPRRLVQRMEEITIKWAISRDQEFPLSDIKRFKLLFPDNGWYSLISDKEGYAIATEDVQFKATIMRPKKEASTEEATSEAADDDSEVIERGLVDDENEDDFEDEADYSEDEADYSEDEADLAAQEVEHADL